MAFMGLNRRMSLLLRVSALAILMVISLRLLFFTQQPRTETSSWDSDSSWESDNRGDLPGLPGGAKSEGHNDEENSKGDDNRPRLDPHHAFSDLDVPRLLRAIMSPLDPEATRDVDMLECPVSSTALSRYAYLREPIDLDRLAYVFTIDLRGRAIDVLPTMLASTIEAMRFLQAGRCALSLIVGDEVHDGTAEVVEALRELIEYDVGSRYKFQRSSEAGLHATGAAGDRSGSGAGGGRTAPATGMKELVLLPLIGEESDWPVGLNTLFVMMNDVAICMEDILELIHQMRWLNADMTCAMDWTPSSGQNVSFLDVWSSRTMSGNTFFDVSADGSWGSASGRPSELLPHDPTARARLDKHQPFQVFSCWSGAVVMWGDPFLTIEKGDARRGEAGRKGVEFRGPRDSGESENCFAGAGEPQRLAKDLWNGGFGRVAAVPAVNVGHGSADAGRAVKRARGFASAWAAAEAAARKAETEAAAEAELAEEIRQLVEEARGTEEEREAAKEEEEEKKKKEEGKRGRREAGQQWMWGGDSTNTDKVVADMQAAKKVLDLEEQSDYKIMWADVPPEKVKCTTGGKEQDWEPWNERMGSL